MTDIPRLFYDLRRTAALTADQVESLPDTSEDRTLPCVGEATFSPSFRLSPESTLPMTCRPGGSLVRGVFLAQGGFPSEVVHHVGEVAVRSGDDHVRWGPHDAGQALFHPKPGPTPGNHAAVQH